jgi:hypothetical protein
MSWLVDAHAHYHPEFGWTPFLEGALENGRYASKHGPVAEELGMICLLLADPAGRDSLAHFRKPSGVELPPAWWWESVGGGGILIHPPDAAPRILLLPGRQVRTAERLEVLVLGGREEVPDGLPLSEALTRGRGDGTICVIPWGFGKWWFGRGRRVTGLLDEPGAQEVALGDNGNRPLLFPEPTLIRRARSEGRLVLPGSDPLPFPSHARRAGSWGLLLAGSPDPARPIHALIEALAAPPSNPPVVGKQRGPIGFVVDQVRMQLRRGRA